MMKFLFYLLITLLSTSTFHAQVGIGTTTPDASAQLEVKSTEKGFLPPRLTTAQRDQNIVNPVEGLMIYNTNTKCLQVYDGQFWISACDGMPDVSTVIGANGVEWMDRNLGASQVATSSTDEDSYGDLYQWGRAADGHEKRISDNYNGTSVRPNTITESGAWDGKFITIPNGTNRNDWVTTQTNDAWNTGTESVPIKTATDPCPSGYRVPTEAEFQTESSNWNPDGAVGAFNSTLKLPLAGERNFTNGGIGGPFGSYWMSTISGDRAKRLRIGGSPGIVYFNNDRAFGFSVRCLKD